jgi:hypothetical protein
VKKQGKKPAAARKKQKATKAASSTAQSSLCWYHARFGEKAHACTSPCSWAEN